jgi:hypothetical protein
MMLYRPMVFHFVSKGVIAMLYLLTRSAESQTWVVIERAPDTSDNHRDMADRMFRRASDEPHRYFRLIPGSLLPMYRHRFCDALME